MRDNHIPLGYIVDSFDKGGSVPKDEEETLTAYSDEEIKKLKDQCFRWGVLVGTGFALIGVFIGMAFAGVF